MIFSENDIGDEGSLAIFMNFPEFKSIKNVGFKSYENNLTNNSILPIS